MRFFRAIYRYLSQYLDSRNADIAVKIEKVQMMEIDNNEYRQQRLANMKALQEKGYKPYGKAFERSGRLADIRAGFEADKRVKAAGRLMTLRNMGKSIFADIRDGSDRFQIYVHKSELGDDGFAAFRLLDIGDHVGVEGTLFVTKTEEKTIKVEKWALLSKALLTLPEKWHGLKDVETRYRQRYLDLATNPETREIFNKRIECISEIRSYLCGLGFQEVETPMMQAQAGGAAAKPFITHYAALGTNMYLRVAPELYLKRLLVGGFDKVFELNRNFRNEGLSRTHNPEFTMLEIYEAYTDVNGMKRIVQGLIKHAAQKVFGTLQVGGGKIDLSGEWREVTYRELVEEKMGKDWFGLSPDIARARAEKEGVTTDPAWGMGLITHEIYEKVIEKSLIMPTFVTRLPAWLVPLAKTCEDDPSVVDVFELVMAGQEIAPAYSELNDPLAQRERLTHQAGSEVTKVDEDFLLALEHGMPPAGGMGIGIDRLIMVLAGIDAIRDVILFPQLKPRG